MRFMHVYHTIKSLSYDWLSMLVFRMLNNAQSRLMLPA